jgi:predicted RNA-binding Zn-ribbon protein involved in translation (DUF1610 family)
MKFILSKSVYVLSKSVHVECPQCGSSDVTRSKKKGLFELTLSSIFHIKPYRCLKCDCRHFCLRPGTGHAHGHAHGHAP